MKKTEAIRACQQRLGEKVDEEFVALMTEINARYQGFSKHQRIRVEQWSRKLCQVTSNLQWKKTRNHYAVSLLDQILNERLDKPFHVAPADGPLPSLSMYAIVGPSPSPQKAGLSPKFFKTQRPLIEAGAAFPMLREIFRHFDRKKESSSSVSKERTEDPPNQLLRKRSATPPHRPAFAGIALNKLNLTEASIALNDTLKKPGKASLLAPAAVACAPPAEDQENAPFAINTNNRALISENVRLKTELEVLDITMQHLKTELERKTSLATQQAIEIAELRRELAQKNVLLGHLAAKRVPPLSLPVRPLGTPGPDEGSLESRVRQLTEEKEVLTRETEALLEQPCVEEGGSVVAAQAYSTNEMINEALQSIDDFDQKFRAIYR